MKKLLAAIALVPVLLFAGENEQKIDAPISSVIVYLSGGEIMHKKQVTLVPGRNELVFVGLSSHLIPKSIQFSGTGDFALLAISSRIDYLFGQKKSDIRIKQVLDSMIVMEDALSITRGNIDAYTRERTMLDQNRVVDGGADGVSAAELKATSDFYVTRMMEINAEIVKLNRKATNQQEILDRLTLQYDELNQRDNPPMAEITILVNNATTASLVSQVELRYVVSDCGWAPAYDLIAEDVGKPIDLKYRAKVFNSTEVDWKNVKMKLSTADPMQSAIAPVMEKWTLNFENNNNRNYYDYNQQQQSYNNYEVNAPGALSSQNVWNTSGKGNDGKDGPVEPVQYENIQVSELAAEFDIKQTYDIPANGQPYIVDVTTHTLNATYRYSCIPKMEREAFLLARITGWEDLDLVEGPANVYFGGTYVGQSYIYTRSVDDTLDLSLGRDKKLVVTRTKLKEFNNEKTAGASKKETFSYEIVVKNTRKTPVEVEVMDQIPVSQDAEIVVEAIELTKGVLDPATGFVTWRMNIPPGEQQRVVLTYSIKYPKSKQVNTRKYKTKARAKF
jgi:uncharacterized protein (TIGR02231 family)